MSLAGLLALWIAGGPALARADAIPGQVPEVSFIVAEPAPGRRLRGDFEVSPWVLLSYSSVWPRTLAALAEQILDSGARVALVRDADSSRRAVERWIDGLDGAASARIELFLDEPIDTPWVRDWGPLQLELEQGPLWVDALVVDGGGERRGDEAAPIWLGRRHAVSVEALGWTVDGGALISNGAGLCVLTREFLVRVAKRGDPGEARPHLGRLGCALSVVVPTLVDEQTKHADMIAQFVSPTRIMVAELDELRAAGPSEDALRLDAAAAGIVAGARQLGVELELVRVPTPPSRRGSNPRSYVNGLRLGDRYLMPSYPELGESSEGLALAAVREALADVRVVAVDSSELIAAGGALHCASLGLFTP